MTGLVTKGRRQQQLKSWAFNKRKWEQRRNNPTEAVVETKPKETTCEQAIEKAKKAGLPLRF